MDNKFTYIKERILYIIENKGFKKESFFKSIGMTYGNFKGELKKKPINSNALENILSKIPDVNAYWLITGKGEMLLKNNKQQETPDVLVLNDPNAAYYVDKEKKGLYERIEELKEAIQLLKQQNGNKKDIA